MSGTPWCKAEEKLLREMLEAGKSLSEILAHPVFRGRTEASIRSKCRTLGVSLAEVRRAAREKEILETLKIYRV